MKKVVFFALIFLCKNLGVYAQSQQEISQNIAKFIDGTVNIPFMARVAKVQGSVRIRINLNDQNLPISYEVVNSLRNDCDQEAMRVIKLVNIKNIPGLLKGKKTALFEVPFFSSEKIYFQDGFVSEFFDSNKNLAEQSEQNKYFRKFPVDSISGKITGNIDYFEIKKNKNKLIGRGVFLKDSTNKYYPEFSENRSDSLSLLSFTEENDLGFPAKGWTEFPNGNIPFKTIGNHLSLKYFPNGSIKSVSETTREVNSNTILETNWFANGQIANEKKITIAMNGEIEEIISAYDTVGNQLVKEGKGEYIYSEFYENSTLTNIGNINNGQKDGKWIGKLEDGNIIYEEDYMSGKLTKGIGFYQGEKIEYYEVNKQAEMIGGINAFQQHLLKNLRYPAESHRARITGKVFLSFDVCTDGTLCNYQILKGVEKNLNNEALRVVKLTNGKWQPALVRGKPVKNKFNLPISFMLQ